MAGANSVKASVKAAMETVGRSSHQVWPVHGRTKASREPLVSVLDDRGGVLSAGAPDAPQDGLEADTMLVGRPWHHILLRVSALPRLHDGRPDF
jgi:hypothetical protein